MAEAAAAIAPHGNWPAPQVGRLGDGRLHLQDGPIDLIIGADGARTAIETAYRAAAQRFDGLLAALCTELPRLRAQATPDAAPFHNPIALRMQEAVARFAADAFITPMAAVAGAVADAVLAAMTTAAPLTRAYVNNGGDIALHLTPKQSFEIGLVDRPDRPSLFARTCLRAEDGIGGIASSGWRGRSFSLGIADAVTVLAATGAAADAAATLIANAVDLPDHRGIVRLPAQDLQPGSDLGARLVTRAVPVLDAPERCTAIDRGLIVARCFADRGLIHAAALHLQGETRIVGAPLLASPETRNA